MSDDKSQIRKYPLLPFSQLVYDMTRWVPIQYTIAVRVKGISIEFATAAFRTVLENHPVFQMQIDRNGRQFASSNEDIFKGKYHTFSLWEKHDFLYMKMVTRGILGDNRSVYILAEDLMKTYLGQPLAKDFYWEYVAEYESHKNGVHYQESREWLEYEFSDLTIPVHPTIDREIVSKFFPAIAGVYKEDYSNLQNHIHNFSQSKHLSVDGLFSLCAALAIADYCGVDEAALTWAYDGRKTEKEQHIFGCLHCDVPFKICRKSSQERGKWASKEELIKTARNQIRLGIAHSDYPYTLMKPNTKRWNTAVNVYRVVNIENILELIPVPFEVVTYPSDRFAHALLDVEIHESFENLELVYRYSATHYKEESIQKFAALVRKYAEWLLEE